MFHFSGEFLREFEALHNCFLLLYYICSFWKMASHLSFRWNRSFVGERKRLTHKLQVIIMTSPNLSPEKQIRYWCRRISDIFLLMTSFSRLCLLRIKFYLNIQQLIIGRMQTISCYGRLANRCRLAMYDAKYVYVSIK